jgi:hypothetical protein
MQIAIYALLMVCIVAIVLTVGNILISRSRHPLWICALAVGCIVITVSVAYAVQAVHIRKQVVVAWR